MIGLGLSIPQVAVRGGSGSNPLLAYAVNGLTPETVADFGAVKSDNPLFAYTGLVKTFSDMFDYTGASNKVMTDSTGLAKWAPHNLLTYSEQFDNAAWGFGSGSGNITGDAATAPNGTESADRLEAAAGTWFFRQIFTGNHRISRTCGFWIKSGGTGKDTFRLAVNGASLSADLTATDEWQFFSHEGTRAADGLQPVGILRDTSDNAVDIFIWGARFYRSDLAGMASVPADERGLASDDTYVPTTTAARYLPRRDSYRYNGTSFVRKGLRLESEQRTNLDPNSDDLSAWTTSNTTIAKNQTGADGVANSAHSITATANGGTALEQITATSNPHVWSCLMKRITGTGTVEVTVNGGSTWVDVTAAIYTGAFVTASTGPGVTVTNPEFGVRLGTSGDVVAVQVSQLEQTSGQASSPIPTNGSAVTRAAETDPIAAAKMAANTTGMSFHIQGELDYADEGAAAQVTFMRWQDDASNFISIDMDTDGAATGEVNANQNAAGTLDTVAAAAEYTPGLNVPFNIASRNTSGAINVAKDGTAATADTTPTALADLSATNFELGQDFMGHVELFVHWNADIGDAGIAEATQ